MRGSGSCCAPSEVRSAERASSARTAKARVRMEPHKDRTGFAWGRATRPANPDLTLVLWCAARGIASFVKSAEHALRRLVLRSCALGPPRADESMQRRGADVAFVRRADVRHVRRIDQDPAGRAHARVGVDLMRLAVEQGA